MKCFCKKKTVPYQESIVSGVREIFEKDCMRLACILDQEGKIISKTSRSDVLDIEVDSVLNKVAAIKTRIMQLPSANDNNSSIHIQGKSICCSLYNLPDKNLLVLLIDTNALTSSMSFISDTRALVYAKIGEIFMLKKS